MSEFKYCPYCGKSLPHSPVYCPYCGKQVKEFLKPEKTKIPPKEEKAKTSPPPPLPPLYHYPLYQELVAIYTKIYGADGRSKLDNAIKEYINQGLRTEEAIQKVHALLKKYRFI